MVWRAFLMLLWEEAREAARLRPLREEQTDSLLQARLDGF